MQASTTTDTSFDRPSYSDAIPQWTAAGPITKNHVLGVLPGEGVGPEVVNVALDVLEVVTSHSDHRFDRRSGGPIGVAATRATGQSLTPEVIDFCNDVFDEGGAVFCGPGGDRFVYNLRATFDLYCKLVPLRPVPALHDCGPLRPAFIENLDIVVVRENTGGLYFGEWDVEMNGTSKFIARHQYLYKRDEVERILRVALSLARMRRGRLVLVTKPGGLPALSQIWEHVLEELNRQFGIDTRILEVDNAVYQLIADAKSFDVIACPNMFGDIIGDCGGLLLGSRGMSFSGNFAPDGRAVYQTGHGAAWDLAGTDRANPIGQVLSLAMMLRETYSMRREAAAVEQAVQMTLSSGVRTADISGPECHVVGTRELGAHVCEMLESVFTSASS